MSALAVALAAELFPEASGELTVGGIPASRLAAEHGTPLYVYDAGILRGRFAALRGALPDPMEVHYSVKANPNPAVIRCLVAEGAGCEIASAAEYLRARAAGCSPARIVFAGPAKGEAELELVVREGIGEIHVESGEEIATLAAIAAALGKDVDVAVRVNPAPEAAGGAMQMGGRATAFGFDEEGLLEVALAILGAGRLRLRGVHVFAGTQILDAGVLLHQWRHAIAISARLAAATGERIRTVDLGGGLGIPYFPRDPELDLEALRSGAAALVAALPPALAGVRLLVEPGRFLAGPAGVYLARVRAVKRSRGATFVVLDGGMNHHLAASGNLGQVLKRDYPIVNASRPSAPPALRARVCGPLCTPLDTLGREVLLPETRPGDLIAVLQSGAYGLSASPVGFLSHPTPAEVLVDRGDALRVRERGTFAHPCAPLP